MENDPMEKFENLLRELEDYENLPYERQCELFDECEAWYTFSMLWHGGMNDPVYSITGRLETAGFKLSPMGGSYEHLTEEGKEYYDQLLEDFGYEENHNEP